MFFFFSRTTFTTNHHRRARRTCLYSKYLRFFMSEVCSVDSTWAQECLALQTAALEPVFFVLFFSSSMSSPLSLSLDRIFVPLWLDAQTCVWSVRRRPCYEVLRARDAYLRIKTEVDLTHTNAPQPPAEKFTWRRLINKRILTLCATAAAHLSCCKKKKKLTSKSRIGFLRPGC